MKTAVFTLLFCVAICLCVACTSSPRVTVTRGDQDTGTLVELSTGDTLALALRANPTTGYGWIIAAVDTTILRKIDAGYIPDNVPKGIVGSGGRAFLRFEATKPGKTAVELEYKRSWETAQPPAKTFELDVSVRK